MISFCTTCKGRKSYLLLTLSHNLQIAQRALQPGTYEFVILGYGDSDNLWETLRSVASIRAAIIHGLVTLLEVTGDDAPYYLEAHSKNICHIFSRGDILANVDADNFLSIPFCQDVARLLPNQVLMAPVKSGDTAGRIALYRDTFIQLGGYDEDRSNKISRCFIDSDLKLRAIASGFEPVTLDSAKLHFIPHNHIVRNQHYEYQPSEINEVSITDATGEKQTLDNIRMGKLRASKTTRPVRVEKNRTTILQYVGIH